MLNLSNNYKASYKADLLLPWEITIQDVSSGSKTSHAEADMSHFTGTAYPAEESGVIPT